MKPLIIFVRGLRVVNPQDLSIGLDAQLNTLDNHDHVGPLTMGGGIGVLIIIQQILENQIAVG